MNPATVVGAVQTGGTANGVAYLNGSKVITSGTALTFDGTNFATTGTASASKVIPTGSSVTGNGLYLPAANALGLSTNGTNAVYIDSLQNVGIGTTPNGGFLTGNKFEVNAGSLGTTAGNISAATLLNANDGNTTVLQTYNYRVSNGSNHTTAEWRIQRVVDATRQAYTGYGSDYLALGTTNTERARIDSSGNLIVNGTVAAVSAKFTSYAASAGSRSIAVINTNSGDSGTDPLYISKFDNVTTSSNIFVRFAINNQSTGSGQINANGGNSAAFGTYSDSRLKENIVDLPSQLANIMALRPVEYDYIESEGGGHQIGFVAQEVQEVYPDLVGERADGMLTLSDMNKNDARLIKCIQEQQALITALTARIEALENK
jgi:hypothetical protein